MSKKLIHKLQNQHPELLISVDPNDLQHYGRDWTHQWQPKASAIAFVRSKEEVLALTRFANAQGLPLVPSGGRTGLSGGAVATAGELVVSFSKMDRILSFDPLARTVTCQSGVVTEKLQQFAEDNHLYYPVSFAAEGSSCIGGNIATNAGGIHVMRYGMTRDWVVGMVVVTGGGELLELNANLPKNATGYDLKQLFIGSEGTLGFVVEATLKLTQQPPARQVLLLAVDQFSAMNHLLLLFSNKLALSAAEFFCATSLSHVLAKLGRRSPFGKTANYYLLLEFDCSSEIDEQQMQDAFSQALDENWVIDGIFSQSAREAHELWQLRENITESISPHKPYKNDISVPITGITAFIDKLQQIVTEHYPAFALVWFGHLGDGNLHLNILKPENMAYEQFVEHCQQVNKMVFDTVSYFHGSISAEHGIGLLKKPYLSVTRSAQEIAYFKQIKRVFDPNNIMNPGKIFDLEPQE